MAEGCQTTAETSALARNRLLVESAVAAGAAQHDVVRRDVVAAAAGDPGDRLLERRVLERLDLSAVAADEVVVVLTLRIRALEARHTVAEVDALDEAELGEAVERPVDARDPDPGAARAHGVVDLER